MMDSGQKRYTLAINLITRDIFDVELGSVIELPAVDISELASRKCPHCYGRGRSAYNLTRRQVEPCDCARKNLVKKLIDLRLKHGLINVSLDSLEKRTAAEAAEYGKIVGESRARPKKFWARIADVFRHVWWKLTDGRDKDVVAVIKQVKGRTAVKTIKEYDLLKEGPVKKGGVNPPPKTAKPEYTPVPQKQSAVLNKNMSGK